jgi:hypothetical protein
MRSLELSSSLRLGRSSWAPLYDVFNSSVEDVATTVDGLGVEVQRVRAYNNLSAVAGLRAAPAAASATTCRS